MANSVSHGSIPYPINNALAGQRYDLIIDHRIKKQQEETDKTKENTNKAADAYKKAEEEKTRKKGWKE